MIITEEIYMFPYIRRWFIHLEYSLILYFIDILMYDVVSIALHTQYIIRTDPSWGIYFKCCRRRY